MRKGPSNDCAPRHLSFAYPDSPFLCQDPRAFVTLEKSGSVFLLHERNDTSIQGDAILHVGFDRFVFFQCVFDLSAERNIARVRSNGAALTPAQNIHTLWLLDNELEVLQKGWHCVSLCAAGSNNRESGFVRSELGYSCIYINVRDVRMCAAYCTPQA